MIEKPFDSITRQDIQALVDDKVPEGTTIEYKQDLPGRGDEAKREFLKDVSALANSAGGDLLFGIEEERDDNSKPTGLPARAHGLSLNADAEKLRLESTIRDGLAPRLPGVQMQTIDGFSDGSILLMRIPKSWAAPHQVSFKNLARFFARTSAGTYQLDVSEIRAAFVASDDLPRRIEDFRINRIARIKSGETPIPMDAGPKYILHIIPLSAVTTRTLIDLQNIAWGKTSLRPMNAGGWSHRMNLDGYLTHNSNDTGRCSSYAQLFRTGAIEFVESGMFLSRSGEVDNFIPSELFEKATVRTVDEHLPVLAGLGITPPVSILLSLTNVKHFTMCIGSSRGEGHYIDRDDLLLPDVISDSMKPDAPKLLRPVFDATWQASGFPGSLNYTSAGVWNIRRTS